MTTTGPEGSRRDNQVIDPPRPSAGPLVPRPDTTMRAAMRRTRRGRKSGLLGQFAGRDQAVGHVAELDVVVLRVAPEHREGLIAIDAEPFHQDALGLTDQLPRVDRLPERGLLPGAGQGDRGVPG